MSRRSIRKVIARARREAYIALKYHVKGLMWVDNVTVDSHLGIFSDDYMKYFWSHLTTSCSFLRPLQGNGPRATPESIAELISSGHTIDTFAGTVRVRLPHSTFYLKEYTGSLSCGPDYAGNTVLDMRPEDVAELIRAYDQEVRRCDEVVPKAIREALAESVALAIALAAARRVAGDLISRHGIEIEATDAGKQRVKYTVSFRRDPVHEVVFWASMDELRPRLMSAVRSLLAKKGRVSTDE